MLLLFSAVGLALLLAEYASGAADRLELADAGWTAAALTAVVGLTAAWRGASEAARPGWRLLAAAGSAWLIGQLIWAAYGDQVVPASPNAADACWLVFALTSAAGIHRLTFAEWRARRVSWLELLPLMTGACSLIAALLWGVILRSKIPEAAILTSLAYPVLYVAAVLVMSQATLVGALDLRRNPGMVTLLVGLGLEAVAFSLWSPLLLAGSYTPGTTAVDLLWGVGMMLIGLGAWTARPPAPVELFELMCRRRGGVLPSLTFATVAGFLIILLAEHAPRGAALTLSIGVTIVGGALIARASILRRRQDALYDELDRRGRQLQLVNQQLIEESRRDALTGLGNRLRLREDLAELTSRCEGEDRPLLYSMVLIDLDHFKRYNDEHGHLAGDLALQRVSNLMARHIRDGNRAYRFGGEEILLILLNQDAAAAAAVAENCLTRLLRARIPHPTSQTRDILTFSAGVAAAHPGETPEQVLRRADEALYHAKDTGRQRVLVAAPHAPSESRASEDLPATDPQPQQLHLVTDLPAEQRTPLKLA